MSDQTIHNFYKHWCADRGEWRYFAVCKRMILQPDGKLAQLNPSCVEQIRKKTCPAMDLLAEEMWGTSYWLDRDDAGDGVVSRTELAGGARVFVDATTRQRPALLPSTPDEALSIEKIINAEIAKLGVS